MNNFNEILVVAGVFFSEGRVLAALRPRFKPSGGCWEFPGGKVEKGESSEEALTRELLEELNVSVQVLNQIAQSQADVGGKAIKMMLFEVKLREGEIVAKEHEELRWVAEDELESLHWAPLDVPLLEAVRAILIKRPTKKSDI